MEFVMIFPIGGSTRISTRLMTRAGRPARRVAGPGRVAKNFAMQFPTQQEAVFGCVVFVAR